MTRRLSPLKQALLAWYHRDQRSRAHSRNLATLFAALPRWEQAVILAPALLWICCFVFYEWQDGYLYVRSLLIGLSRSVCPFMDFNPLCWLRPAPFLYQSGVFGLQLVSVDFLTIALTLLLVVVQLGRAVLRLPAATVRTRWRDWVFGAIVLAIFHSGLLFHPGTLTTLRGSVVIILFACVSLFFVRALLSPLIRSSNLAPAEPLPVIRRLR